MRGEAPNRDAKSSARLKGLAKNLRRRQTEHERILWNLLRNRRFADYKFRRQVAIGPYVADFACLSARLIVELDGTQHAESARDELRDRWLHDDDFRVLRIWNGDLIRNRARVLDTIWFALHPSPASLREAPSPAGGEGEPAAPPEIAPDVSGTLQAAVSTPSPLAGEGGAQRRMRGGNHPREARS